MEISAIQPGMYPATAGSPVSPQEASKRRELIQAAKAVNTSGALGEQNELVFVLNPGSNEAILRLVDRKTGEVMLQLPPEYVLRLAQDLRRKT